MPQKGLTLLELLITLVILAIILSIGLPSFQQQLQASRTQTLTLNLYEAAQAARTRAISRNGRVTLRALEGDWSRGWVMFDDLNHNGLQDPDESAIVTHRVESLDVAISGNNPVSQYLSYVGTGEGRLASGTPGGVIQMGSLTLCPTVGTGAYKLVLAGTGRLRKEAIDARQCRG